MKSVPHDCSPCHAERVVLGQLLGESRQTQKTVALSVVGFGFAPLGEVLPDLGAARPIFQILQVITRVVVIAHCTLSYTLYPLKAR